ncbi:MAG: hypothetical protein GX620_03740 [Chloroflexi bacterium]|nr:hypothetical protein [Chloroflexota bacterium]
MSKSTLQIGFGEVNITPPVGLAMCGSLQPRTNVGVDDPLMAKTLAARAGDETVAIVGVDLIGIPKALADDAIAEASRRSGVQPDKIMISCSHTHSGPYTIEGLYSFGVTDEEYLSTLPDAIARSVEQAVSALQPATMHVGRAVVYHYLHHRRVVAKDGKAINTWMSGQTNDLRRTPQLLGTSGPIDPELWVVRFDDADGVPFGAFVNFSLHVNTHFGDHYSADYPGVIAANMRHVYGAHFSTVFTPGACANINSTRSGLDHWREAAEFFSHEAIQAAREAIPVEEPIVVGGARRDLAVPRRDPESQPEEAISRLDWGGGRAWHEVFDPMLNHIGAMPEALTVPINAVRIGPLGVASNPGELFVEHGLSIKRRSPMPYTTVAELTNDIILYQPTREAFEQQGYETLVGANRVSIDGIEMIVDTAVELLEELWGK